MALYLSTCWYRWSYSETMRPLIWILKFKQKIFVFIRKGNLSNFGRSCSFVSSLSRCSRSLLLSAMRRFLSLQSFLASVRNLWFRNLFSCFRPDLFSCSRLESGLSFGDLLSVHSGFGHGRHVSHAVYKFGVNLAPESVLSGVGGGGGRGQAGGGGGGRGQVGGGGGGGGQDSSSVSDKSPSSAAKQRGTMFSVCPNQRLSRLT